MCNHIGQGQVQIVGMFVLMVGHDLMTFTALGGNLLVVNGIVHGNFRSHLLVNDFRTFAWRILFQNGRVFLDATFRLWIADLILVAGLQTGRNHLFIAAKKYIRNLGSLPNEDSSTRSIDLGFLASP
jgi:hypothetical protein